MSGSTPVTSAGVSTVTSLPYNYWDKESLLYKYYGDWRLGFGGTGSLLLQVAHPVIGAGVGEYSVYKTDPWGRLERTSQSMMKLVYGGAKAAHDEGERLRNMHREIKGTDHKGRAYFALNPEAYAWVHATMAFVPIVQMCNLVGKPLTYAETRQLYAECRQLGRVLGVREKDMPETVEEFWEYFDDMIENRLEYNYVVEDLAYHAFGKQPPPPFLSYLPKQLWYAISLPPGKIARIMTLGALPARFRERMNIGWNSQNRFIHQMLCQQVRLLSYVIPDALRYHFYARQAMWRKAKWETSA